MTSKITTLLFLFLFFLLACNSYRGLPSIEIDNDWKVKKLTASPQAKSGDATAGFEYLHNGDYIGSGIPYEFIIPKLGNYKDTLFHRKGESSRLSYENMVFEAQNGAKVMSGNCFTCHAAFLNGKFIPGLGNSLDDYTKDFSFQMKLINFLVKRKFKKGTPEREAYQTYSQTTPQALSYIVPPNPGVNPAFRLEEAYGKIRNPHDLTVQKNDNFNMIKYTLASDVPPWWHFKKKNALYYNGMGRGDFRKLLMQASLQGIKDSTHARQVHEQFDDVVAYLKSVEAPPYPAETDEQLALKGKTIFEDHCQKCHGTYGENESYPNKLVSLSVVQTDPYYARYFSTNKGLADWYNQSWYAQSEPTSHLEPLDAYIAPPLDGVWASAPYFHNASVPTLEDVLNSPQRPIYWERSWKNDDYDYQKVGWNYTQRSDAKLEHTYDTTLPGYGNMGHYFGDELSSEERTAVIEYLKTL